MASSTYVDKAEVVAVLRSRDLHGRADWVDRELPMLIDTGTSSSLFHTLGIDVTTLTSRVTASAGRPGGADGS